MSSLQPPTPGPSAQALAEEMLGVDAHENPAFLMGYSSGVTYMGSSRRRRRRALKAYRAFLSNPGRIYTMGFDEAHHTIGMMAAAADCNE